MSSIVWILIFNLSRQVPMPTEFENKAACERAAKHIITEMKWLEPIPNASTITGMLGVTYKCIDVEKK